MGLTVRVSSGRIEEFENGIKTRGPYGSNFIAANTDGKIIAAINKDGRIQEFEKGMPTRGPYGQEAAGGLQVSGGVVSVQTKNGRSADYKNGSLYRSY